jgi:hypothetical protein
MRDRDCIAPPWLPARSIRHSAASTTPRLITPYLALAAKGTWSLRPRRQLLGSGPHGTKTTPRDAVAHAGTSRQPRAPPYPTRTGPGPPSPPPPPPPQQHEAGLAGVATVQRSAAQRSAAQRSAGAAQRSTARYRQLALHTRRSSSGRMLTLSTSLLSSPAPVGVSIS